MRTEREQTYVYSTSQQSSTGGSPFANVLNTGASREQVSATTSGAEKTIDFIPKPVTVILGSTYSLIVLCILLVIPILELAIGGAYRDQCPINSNIPVYLIVTGACGIASIVLTIAIIVAFICCIKQSTTGVPFVSGCIIVLILVFLFLMSLFLFIWFIVGNVWIFGAYKSVNMDDPTSSNYCHRTLYQFAFVMLILSYIMAVISCCSSCVRSCIQAGKALKK